MTGFTTRVDNLVFQMAQQYFCESAASMRLIFIPLYAMVGSFHGAFACEALIFTTLDAFTIHFQ